MNEPTPTLTNRRSWHLRFGLRTLFTMVTLVAMACGWVTYSLNWIRQRREGVYNRPPLQGDHIDLAGKLFATNVNSPKRRAPGWLWLFGEPGFDSVIYYSPVPEQEIDRAKRLFPEAQVWDGNSSSRPAQ